MSQPAIAASAFTWGLAQVKHALPPTIFFFVGFNLILWTKRLILQEHGIEFSGFFTTLVAALLVGKAVLVTDNCKPMLVGCDVLSLVGFFREMRRAGCLSLGRSRTGDADELP